MKNLLKTAAFVGMGISAFGASAYAAHHTEAEREVRAMFDEATASFVACDKNSIGKYNAERHTGFYPDSMALIDETSDAAIQSAVDFCENGGKHELAYEIGDLVMLNDAALVLGAGHYKRTEPGGVVSVDTDYTFTDVLVKTGNGWKFRHTHIGVVVPMEDAAVDE